MKLWSKNDILSMIFSDFQLKSFVDPKPVELLEVDSTPSMGDSLLCLYSLAPKLWWKSLFMKQNTKIQLGLEDP